MNIISTPPKNVDQLLTNAVQLSENSIAIPAAQAAIED